MRTLYLTSPILSMIWTLGDFNSVYLLTGGGPADLTHVLATLGIRYLRLDQVDLAMAAIVVALPLVLPLVYFMMKRLVEMNAPGRWSSAVATEAKLLLIGIPVLLWTMIPIYHLFLFAISGQRLGDLGPALAEGADAAELRASCSAQKHFYLEPLLAAALELAADRGRGRRDHAVRRHRARRSRSAG